MNGDNSNKEERKHKAAVNGRAPVRFWRLIGLCAAVVAGIGILALIGWARHLPGLASARIGWIPVAPSTATLFILYAVSLYLRSYHPQNKVFRRGGMALIAGGALISALLFAISVSGMYVEHELLGFVIENKPGQPPLGHMSPVTAFCFMLSSLSYLLSLSTGDRRWFSAIASMLASIVIAAGSMLALSYLYGMPVLYGGPFIPPAAPTSMAFVALGSALLALAWPHAWPARKRDASTSGASYAFLLVFVFLATGIVTAGYLYYRAYEKNYRTEIERQLAAVAELKVDWLSQWRKERLGDASLFYQNGNFSRRVTDYLMKPKDVEAHKSLLTWMRHVQEGYQYDRVFLIDAGGKVRVSVPDDRRFVSRNVLDAAAAVLHSQKVSFLDFYRNEYDSHVYLALLIPIVDEQNSGRALGTLVLRIDPKQHYYPYLNRWPTPSKTAETLLVRREGKNVVFLNDLKFQAGTALNLKRPLSQKELPAAQAVLDRTGIMEGVDYRGVPVIADLRAVPDSPWFLVSRMDLAEINEPLQEKLWMLVTLVSALIMGAGGVVGLVWRRERTEFYRESFHASEALRESEERFRILVEGVKDYAIIMLDPEGNVMSWNQGAERIKGYQDNEIIGAHFSRFYSDDDIQQGKPRRELEQAAETGRSEDEGWRLRKDGSRYWASVVISALRDEKGKLRGFSKITRDITEHKRVDDKLKETLADLQRSNKELEQFAYVASHDLQEPLRMVSSYTQLLAERYENKLDDKANTFIRYAVDGAVRMQQLINDLLAFSRIGTRGMPLAPVDAGSMLESALMNLNLIINDANAVVTHDKLPEVRADGTQLAQLFQNLIGNAVKFRGPERPLIHLSVRDEGREWLFSVRDNGIGIDPLYTDKIFVIFQRLHTKEEYPGSGIGLAICKKIVDRHGGKIWFESEPGKGATFYFTIPK